MHPFFPRIFASAVVAFASMQCVAADVESSDAASRQVLATQRYCAAPDIPVPEGDPPALVRFEVPESGTVTDVDLELMTTHAHTGDLFVHLGKGSKTVRLLEHSMGMPPNEIGCQGSAPHLVFDDEGTNGFAQDQCRQGGPAYQPPGGGFTPLQALSAFDGSAAQGTYLVTVMDPFPGDPGNIQILCLSLTTTGPDRIFANGFD